MSVKEPAAREITAPLRLFVVARRDPELYGYLRARFADEAGVSVVLDRRVEMRRRRALPAAAVLDPTIEHDRDPRLVGEPCP